MTVDADPASTRFALCIEEAAMAPADATTTLTTTRFTRPTLATATVNAKAACLYPNNARMLKEAQSKGFANAIACDAGSAMLPKPPTSNIFMVKNGEIISRPSPMAHSSTE